MDQLLSGGLIEPASGHAELRLRLVEITSRDCFANFSKLGTQGSSLGAIANSVRFVLAKTFFGAAGVWHVKERRVGPRQIERTVEYF